LLQIDLPAPQIPIARKSRIDVEALPFSNLWKKKEG
jgi:hypothetical protein